MSAMSLIATFLEAQAAELDASQNTQLAYARDLKDFSGWLDRRGLAILAAQQADIEKYLIDLDAAGMSRATRARRLSAIRQFFRFAFEEGWREDNPAIRIKGPGREKRLPKTLSIEEVERLLEAARTTGREADRKRNTCLMEVLYATGMRVSELVSLPSSAARGDPRMLLIRGKGGKERMVPLSPPAREALSEWLLARDSAEEVARCGAGTPASRFLFPSHGKAGHLTRHRFYGLIKEFAGGKRSSPRYSTARSGRTAEETGARAPSACKGCKLGSLQNVRTLRFCRRQRTSGGEVP